MFIPPKKNIFLKTLKNIEIQKNGPSLRMYENIRVPPPPPGQCPLKFKDRFLLRSFHMDYFDPIMHHSA